MFGIREVSASRCLASDTEEMSFAVTERSLLPSTNIVRDDEQADLQDALPGKT